MNETGQPNYEFHLYAHEAFAVNLFNSKGSKGSSNRMTTAIRKTIAAAAVLPSILVAPWRIPTLVLADKYNRNTSNEVRGGTYPNGLNSIEVPDKLIQDTNDGVAKCMILTTLTALAASVIVYNHLNEFPLLIANQEAKEALIKDFIIRQSLLLETGFILTLQSIGWYKQDLSTAKDKN